MTKKKQRRSNLFWEIAIFAGGTLNLVVVWASLRRDNPEAPSLVFVAASILFAVALGFHSRRLLKISSAHLEAVYRKLGSHSPHAAARVATVMNQLAKFRGRAVHSGTAMLLVAAGLLAILHGRLPIEIPFMVLALTAAALLLEVAFAAFLWRLRRGLYGTTDHEARQIVRFVLANAGRVDFSGGLGAPELLSSEAALKVERTWGVTT